METTIDVHGLKMIIFFFWLSGIFIGLGIGVIWGKYIERKEWNQLIKEGKIPAPKRS